MRPVPPSTTAARRFRRNCRSTPAAGAVSARAPGPARAPTSARRWTTMPGARTAAFPPRTTAGCAPAGFRPASRPATAGRASVRPARPS